MCRAHRSGSARRSWWRAACTSSTAKEGGERVSGHPALARDRCGGAGDVGLLRAHHRAGAALDGHAPGEPGDRRRVEPPSLGIRPFQRTKRQALVHRLVTDPKVQQAAERYAIDKKLSLSAAMQRVDPYAAGIWPGFKSDLH